MTTIRYLQHTYRNLQNIDQIYSGHQSIISKTPIKYLKDTY